MKEIVIDSPGPDGFGTKTSIDGTEIHGLTNIGVSIGLEEPSVVTLQMYTSARKIHLNGEVLYEALLVDPNDMGIISGSGSSVQIAVLELLDSLNKKYQ